MAAKDLHLSVHLGQRWTAAVCDSNGRVQPVLFDGQARVFSGVFVDPSSAALSVGGAALSAAMNGPEKILSGALGQLRSGGTSDPTQAIGAISALLAHVANAASLQAGNPVSGLTVTTPEPWGPRSRQRLTQAATAAGLPEPAIVTAAAAAAALTSDTTAQVRTFVLVCESHDPSPILTVLDAAGNYTQLATTTVRNPGAPGIHEALAKTIHAQVGTDTSAASPMDWRTDVELDRVTTALTTQQRVPVLLPGTAPAVLETTDLIAALQPHLAGMKSAVATLLQDADIEQDHLTACVLVAYDASAGLVQQALTEAGLPPTVIVDQPHQLAEGASRLTKPQLNGHSAEPTAATTRLPRTRLSLGSLTATTILAVCSVALLLQTVATTDVYKISNMITGARMPVENLALAAALAAATALAAAQLAPTTWLSPKGLADHASTGYLLRRSYLAAAAVGIALAGLWGIGAGVGVGYATSSYVRAALAGAAPIILSATLIGLSSPRLPATRLATWIPLVRPPSWFIAAGAAGIYLIRSAYTLTFPANITGQPGLIAAAGAAALGFATAATATQQNLIRFTAGPVLAIGYAFVATVNTVGYLVIAYIMVLAWWSLAAAANTLNTIFSPDRDKFWRWLRLT